MIVNQQTKHRQQTNAAVLWKDREALSNAHALRDAGMSNRDIGRQFDISTDDARRLADAGRRLAEIREATAERHPDPDSLKLRPNDKALVLALFRCYVYSINDTPTSSPTTRWVSRIAGKSPGWAGSVARRRLAGLDAEHRETAYHLVEPTRNGYITFTAAGFAVAATLHPELIP